jgi:hypothetical protein
VLDHTNYPSKPRSPVHGVRPIDTLMREVYPLPNAKNVPWPPESQARTLATLKLGAEHVEMVRFDPGVCARLAARRTDARSAVPCDCGLARASTPRFYEMLGKNAQCLEMMAKRELARERRFDWIVKACEAGAAISKSANHTSLSSAHHTPPLSPPHCSLLRRCHGCRCVAGGCATAAT